MKDSEKGLLALALVVGLIYMSKKKRPIKVLTREQGGKLIASWPKKQQQHFMSLSDDGKKAYLVNLGYAEAES